MRYELYYWPHIQGRGEYVRLALEEGEADYVDVARLPESEGGGRPAIVKLLQDAKVILLDEPFTAIDSKTVSDLIALVHRWHAEQRTIIAVLHDIELVRETFLDTVLLAREPVAWGKTVDALTPENLLKARRMNEARDETAPWCEPDAA